MNELLPGATLGVLGGGQLGRMFAQAASTLGYRIAVLEPDLGSPAGMLAQHVITTAYDDAEGLVRLAAISDAITTEFENVPATSLAVLAQSRPVAPAASAVSVCQDRAAEKAHFQRCAVPCAAHRRIDSEAQCHEVDTQLLPGILKTMRLGYDGKGQRRVADARELAAAWHELGGVPCLLEKLLALDFEISVIVARGRDGRCVNFPVQRNLHRDGILAVTEVPAPGVGAALATQATDAAKAIAAGLDYVGVLCVEFFVLQDGSLVANEMAPRPHNSGHHTIDAFDVSQFEMQVRTLAGLALPQPRQHSSAVMLNLLGDLWFSPEGAAVTPPWGQVLALPGAHLHLYGKAEARRGRKMGHLTITAASGEVARSVAGQAAEVLGLPPP